MHASACVAHAVADCFCLCSRDPASWGLIDIIATDLDSLELLKRKRKIS